MARWIQVNNRIIEHIPIPIVTLRIILVWHNRVSLRKATNRAVVPPGVIEHQAERIDFAPLAGERVLCQFVSGRGIVSGDGLKVRI